MCSPGASSRGPAAGSSGLAPWPSSTDPHWTAGCWCRRPCALGERRLETAAGLLHRAVERGIAAGDVDLVTIATVMRGRALLKSGAWRRLSLLDEAMVRVLTRMTSPRTTSVMFCAAIGTCHEVQELRVPASGR